MSVERIYYEKVKQLDYLISYYMCDNYEQLKELFEKRSHELIESWKLRERIEKRIDELLEYACEDCHKVGTMDAVRYCECDCCCYFDELQKLLD